MGEDIKIEFPLLSLGIIYDRLKHGPYREYRTYLRLIEKWFLGLLFLI